MLYEQPWLNYGSYCNNRNLKGRLHAVLHWRSWFWLVRLHRIQNGHRKSLWNIRIHNHIPCRNIHNIRSPKMDYRTGCNNRIIPNLNPNPNKSQSRNTGSQTRCRPNPNNNQAYKHNRNILNHSMGCRTFLIATNNNHLNRNNYCW